MIKSFRFLLQFAWVNLGCLLSFALIVTAGSYATGVPKGAENLFNTYYGTFPLMSLIILFLFAFALCTSNLNLALSFGARRRDFFLSLQGILLMYTGVCWALQLAMSAIPTLFGWSNPERWSAMMSWGGGRPWIYPLLCLTVLALGCLSGLVFTKSKVWGTILIIAAMLVCMAAIVLIMLSAHLTVTTMVLKGHGLVLSSLGRVSLYLSLGMAAVLAVSEGVIWRTVARYMVR